MYFCDRVEPYLRAPTILPQHAQQTVNVHIIRLLGSLASDISLVIASSHDVYGTTSRIG